MDGYFIAFMKRLLLAGMLLLILVGCQKQKELPTYLQPENTTAITDTEIMAESLKLCNVSGSMYYVAEPFIYVNANSRITVMTYAGSYLRDKAKDMWLFTPFLNKQDNVYWDTLAWIEAGKLENGEVLTCIDTDKVPKLFYNFYMTYKPLYNRQKYKATNLTDTL
jgi:hypothetical protein